MYDSAMIRLADAVAAFPAMALKVSTLRAERDRGNLTTYLIGGREYTTLADIEEMFRRCAVTPKALAFGSAPSAETDRGGSQTAKSGSSETARGKSALAAALQTAKRLKGNSRTTSQPSSARRGEAL